MCFYEVLPSFLSASGGISVKYLSAYLRSFFRNVDGYEFLIISFAKVSYALFDIRCERIKAVGIVAAVLSFE